MSPLELPPVSPTMPARPVRKVDPDGRHGGQQRREPRREQAENPPPVDSPRVDIHV